MESDAYEPPAAPGIGPPESFFTRNKMKKMTIRATMGTTMMTAFAGIIYLGHAYLCMLVFFLTCCIFAELVGIRKRQAAERRLPLFRSIQWAWFFVATFFTWSDHVVEFTAVSPKQYSALSSLARQVLDNTMPISFSGYTVLLIVSILSLRKGLYKYQITQYTWTIVTICIVVFQTHVVLQIIYAGLFWFVLPTSLVICNDIMAYYCGQIFGKRLIRRRFLELSPNKTWEGFVGSAICTLVFAWWFSRLLCDYAWMVCVPERITLDLAPLSCTPAPMYQPRRLHAIIEAVLPLYARDSLRFAGVLAPRATALAASLELRSAQLHALSLGLFASFVAPFGGFLSSAIKRAYGIKDFNNLIPGHGGMMDRFDCQFVMFLCTYVHHRTLCSHGPLGVEALLAGAARLTLGEQEELLRRLRQRVADMRGAAAGAAGGAPPFP